MPQYARHTQAAQSTVAVILGGGRGTRLWPLTKYRAKPAVPVAGKYRLIDIPISNCLNAGLDRIYVLTQFLSSSLNQHISRTYQLDPFSKGFVNLEAANQSDDNNDWYQGTSDAVRRNLKQIMQWRPKYILILPGDTIFRMPLDEMLAFHEERKADVTIALHSTPPALATQFGIITLDEKERIVQMTEKPSADKLPPLAAPRTIQEKWGMPADQPYLASMGIYIFNADVLCDVLRDTAQMDFGHHILPQAVQERQVAGYVFNEFWEDIGTIRAFYDVNLMISASNPPFNFYDPDSPIYTRMRFLPASRVGNVEMKETRISEGCMIGSGKLDRCLLGIRGIIGKNVEISNSILMGADNYDDLGQQREYEPVPEGAPPLGIGDDCVLNKVIVDKNARVGKGVKLVNKDGKTHYDDPKERFYVRDGIIIVPKHAILEPGAEF